MAAPIPFEPPVISATGLEPIFVLKAPGAGAAEVELMLAAKVVGRRDCKTASRAETET